MRLFVIARDPVTVVTQQLARVKVFCELAWLPLLFSWQKFGMPKDVKYLINLTNRILKLTFIALILMLKCCQPNARVRIVNFSIIVRVPTKVKVPTPFITVFRWNKL